MLDRISRHIRANVVGYLALFVALSGTALASGVLNKQKVNKIISNRAPGLSVAHAKSADSAGPTGQAGGDLAGTYPSPSLNPPSAPISAGLNDVVTPFSCSGVPTNHFYNFDPADLTSAGYYRDRQGRVFLQGSILQCGTPAGELIFTLPAGFRPEKAESQPAITSGGVFIVSINIDGEVVVSSSGPANFTLDGISFRCGPSGANGCP